MREDIDPWLISIQDEVRSDFGWDIMNDKKSLKLLLGKIESTNIDKWKNHKRHKAFIDLSELVKSSSFRGITVVGAATKSKDLIESISERRMLVIADGSIGILSELSDTNRKLALESILFISSDCDGIPGILLPELSGTTFLLHAHGDNINSWTNFLAHWSKNNNNPNLVITHQLPEIVPYAINPGGFTDGDRAICTLIYMGIDKSKISLAGFSTDFVGKWSGFTNGSKKIRKLKWMNIILKHLGFMEV